MSRYYFNHGPFLNLNVSINEILSEILEVSQLIKKWNVQLLFSDQLWNTKLPSSSQTLREYVYSISDQDVTKVIIASAMDLGPHYEELDSDLTLSVLPSVNAPSFGHKLVTSCFYGFQDKILSLLSEVTLTENEYSISDGAITHSIKNFIGKENLEAELKFGQSFSDINQVFSQIELSHPNIIILESAKKSARKHHFQNEYEAVYKTITALNDIDLSLLVDGMNGEERKERFYKEVGYEISEESTKTMQIQMCRSEREFVVPEKGTRLFEWHIKIGKSTRIHYYIDLTDRMIYIGHCGKHLKTSRRY